MREVKIKFGLFTKSEHRTGSILFSIATKEIYLNADNACLMIPTFFFRYMETLSMSVTSTVMYLPLRTLIPRGFFLCL